MNYRSIGVLGVFRPRFGPFRSVQWRRPFSNGLVPFQDDLDGVDDELFNLEDFQHYQQPQHETQLNHHQLNQVPQEPIPTNSNHVELKDAAVAREPTVFVSQLTDPYTNLAIEDYVFTRMPVPEGSQTSPFNRLMFYINTPCVVVGKNQNPWKEANIPLLSSLHIPLIRRRSGGGTVVHDSGNVNFSFMTPKSQFDRFLFVDLICKAVNGSGLSPQRIKVNERGDIVTENEFKVSGSAYKLAKGRSYHHGTMLLNLKLDILGQLLATSPEENGIVEATASVNSVKSKVANMEMDSDKFIEVVTDTFRDTYGVDIELEEDDKNHNDMFGISDFVEANQKVVRVVKITENTQLPEEVYKTAQELREWAWRFGSTPKFTHKFTNEKYGTSVQFSVGKNGVVEGVEVETESQQITEAFEFLHEMIQQNEGKLLDEKLKYTGSEIAGFITHDGISDWIGQCIDGTA